MRVNSARIAVAWVIYITCAAGAAASEPDQRIEEARHFEQLLADWNARLLAGDAEAVLSEIEAADLPAAQRDDARLWNLRGVCLIARGEHRAAVPALERAIRSDPARSEAHRNLAIALHELGQSGRAMSEFAQALELDPRDLEARLGLANANWKLRRAAPALETLQELDTRQAEDPRVLDLRARLHEAVGDAAAAKEDWLRLEQLRPSADGARRLAELDLPGRRESWLRRCLELDPDAGDCRAQLAQLLLSGGEPAAAAAELERLRDGGPLATQNLQNLLLAYQQLGDRAAVERLLELEPPATAASWGIVALIRREAGDGAAALQALRAGRELAPDDLDLANLEAVLLAEAGDLEAARRIWSWILDRDPEHPQARANLGG